MRYLRFGAVAPLFVVLSVVAFASGCHLIVRPDVKAPTTAEGGEPSGDVRFVSVRPIDREKIAPGTDGSPYWDKVRAGEKLIVGINPSYPPFGVRVQPGLVGTAEAPQPVVGFDADLAQHLAQTLGVPVELRPVASRDALDQLNDGTIDVAMAGLTRTAFRAAQVNFTDPYVVISQAALVERRFVDGSRATDEERRDVVDDYYDLTGISGLRIGVVEGTRPHYLALNNFPDAKIVPFATIDEASKALIAGRLNALVHDDAYVRVWGRIHPGAAGRFSPLLERVTEEPIAIAIRKGDLEFLEFLNAYVAEIRVDGTTDRYFRRHFVDTLWLSVADLAREEQE